MQKTNLCPCGSKKIYAQCCEIFFLRKKFPETPEQLMRSRYTAFTKADADYMQFSMKEGALGEEFNLEEVRAWALSVKWQALKIFKAYLDKEHLNKGYVLFSAIYKQAGKKFEIKELSEFVKQDNGQWLYTGPVETHGHDHKNTCGDASCGHKH